MARSPHRKTGQGGARPSGESDRRGRDTGSDHASPSGSDVAQDGGISSPVKPARSPGELAQSEGPAAAEDEHRDSPLESVGKAVSAPVFGAAEGEEDELGRKH